MWKSKTCLEKLSNQSVKITGNIFLSHKAQATVLKKLPRQLTLPLYLLCTHCSLSWINSPIFRYILPQFPREMLTEQQSSCVTPFKVIKAFTITGYDSQLWHLAAVQTVLFSKTRKWWGKKRANFSHLSSNYSSFMQRYWRFQILFPWYLNLKRILTKQLQMAGNWAAHEVWLTCLLPPPHPWTTKGSSFAVLCFSKAFEMTACICFPFEQILRAGKMLAAPASASWKGCRASSPAYLQMSQWNPSYEHTEYVLKIKAEFCCIVFAWIC